MNKTFCISINGQKAVDLGYAIQNGNCYAQIWNGSISIGQLEVVIDEPGVYNGFPKKWVDVSFIKHENVELAMSMLRRLGFSRCPAVIIEEIDDGNFFNQNELCGVII